MSRLFASFEYLDRGWDVRLLENCSPRQLFVYLLLLTFVLGGDVSLIAYGVFHLHRVGWPLPFNMFTACLLVYRYSRVVYRRLGR